MSRVLTRPRTEAVGDPPAERDSAGGIGLRGLLLTVVVLSLAIGALAMSVASLTAFQRTLLTTVDARLSEVTVEIARHVENSLQAGVVLEQQRRLLRVMADERAQAPTLSSIRVLDENDRILFSTNEAEIGQPVPHQLEHLDRQPLSVAGEQGWREIDATTITIGLPLTGLFGETLGSVTAVLPKDTVQAQQDRFALSLALAAVAITLVGGLIAWVLLALLPQRSTARLRALRQRLDALYAAAALRDPVLPADRPVADAVEIADSLGRFEHWLGRRLTHLAEREAEVHRLDETA